MQEIDSEKNPNCLSEAVIGGKDISQIILKEYNKGRGNLGKKMKMQAKEWMTSSNKASVFVNI